MLFLVIKKLADIQIALVQTINDLNNNAVALAG